MHLPQHQAARQTHVRLATLLLLTLAGACADSPTGARSGERLPTESRATADVMQLNSSRAGEAGVRRLTREVPGFAGYYFDREGRLVLRLTDLGQGESARTHTRAMLVRSGRSQEEVDKLNIVLSEARYDFAELSTWRDRAVSVLAKRDDWTALDIDEERNVLRIGVSEESGIADMQKQMASAQIPEEALEVVVEPFAELTQTKSLSARWRPLIGGTQIGPSGCTLGITARINGQPVILTAAHCSASYGNVDGGAVAQAYGFPLFGAEIRDQSFSCGILGLSTCRHADVAAYTITGIDLNAGESPLRIGTIAKPTTRVWGGTNVGGSLAVALSDPYLEIHDGTTAAVGEVVEKVGVTTGWTYGYVRYTCVDRSQSVGPLIYCQDVADINMEPGDSGSPVFMRLGGTNGVRFVGIAWGRVGGSGTSGIYGNINQLTQALGGPFDFALEPF